MARRWWLVVVLLGCADPSAAPGGGGDSKADELEGEASVRCLVAHVLDDGVLEEGLGAVFDIDRRGIFQVDADATTVVVSAERARLGRHAFSAADGDTIVPTETGARITSGDETFEIHVFPEGLGVLAVDDRHIATLDCRAGAVAPTDDDSAPAANCAGASFWSDACRHRSGQFAASICCQAACAVTILDDDSVLEEGLGAVYAIDADGAAQVDEDASSVSIDLTRDAPWRLGQHAFSAAEGDLLGRQPSLESLYQRFLIDSSSGEAFEVRIFDTSRLGVVLVRGEGEPRVLARLDCRGR